jgi:hypothetical protein
MCWLKFHKKKIKKSFALTDEDDYSDLLTNEGK